MTPEILRALDRTESTFYWAIRFLPTAQRHDLAILYLFCRTVDDIADGTLSEADKAAVLSSWKETLTNPDRSATRHVLSPLLHQVAQRRGIPLSVLAEIVHGVCMDLGNGMRAPDDATFAVYCQRVAGYVGIATARVLGCTGHGVDTFALIAGDAFQITNILRDVHEDALAGRLYVPASVLERVGVPLDLSPMAAITHCAFRGACDLLAQRATDRYQTARALYRDLPKPQRHQLRCAMTMLTGYQLTLRRLSHRGWHPAKLTLSCRPSRLRLLLQAVRIWSLGA